MRVPRWAGGVLAVFLLVGMTLPAVGAFSGELAASSATPEVQLEGNVTKDAHTVGSWGPLAYENNNGETETLPGDVNGTYENPYTYTVTSVNNSEFREFPHDNDSRSAVEDNGVWTSESADSDGTASVSSVTTASGVEAVELATSGQTTGDISFTYDKVSITSDVDKRFLQLGLTVDTLDSGATVEVRLEDADGDYVNATIDDSFNAEDSDVVANATGDGYFYQRQVGKMTVRGNGDGDMAEIQNVNVTVQGADADLDIMALNADRLSRYDLGRTAGDETVHNVTTAGSIQVESLSSLGSSMDGATLKDLTVPVHLGAEDLSEDADVDVESSDASEYPNFDNRVDVYYRLELPDAYDLSWSNTRLTGTQALPDGRYIAQEEAEGVSDTAFTEIDSWTDISGTYSGQGEEVVLDNSIQPGEEIALHAEYVVTADEWDAMTATGGGGGAGAKGGGLSQLPLIGGVVALLAGLWKGVLGGD